MDLTENKLSSELHYTGRIVTVRTDTVTLPGGGQGFREIVSHPGGVAIVPLDENGNVYMVRQYRYAFSDVLLEIPAGKLERGEIPRDAALRELEEEVGVVPDRLTELGVILPSPGFCEEVLHLYLATGLKKTACHPDPDEFLEIDLVPLKKLVGMIADNAITDGKTVAGLLKTKLLLEQE